jgi:biotin carboxyl carrier protein
MTFPATYYVTADGCADPYRVVLAASAEGWTATVELEDQAWTFPIRDGGGVGRAWVGETLKAFTWSDGRLVVDGVEHPLGVESEARHRAGRMRVASPAGGQTREVRAPMPGLIVAVEVEEGTRVETGAGLAVIEAMKMENEILAPASGIVRGIGVRTGQVIEKDVLICRIEPGEPA